MTFWQRMWARGIFRSHRRRPRVVDAPAPLESPRGGVPFRTAVAPNPQSRLRRVAAMCLDGRVAAAEIELHAWCRQESCPPAVRTLLAALLARRGSITQARAVLNHRPRSEISRDIAQDAAYGALLVVLHLADQMPESARQFAAELFAQHGHDPAIGPFLRALQPTGMEEIPPVCEAQADHLAGELLTRPELLNTLVVAQRLAPQAEDIALLRRAGQRMAPEVNTGRKGLALCQGMAELALLAGDADDARRWAHRGLKIDPYCAALALVLNQVEDDPAVGPSAAEVLAQAARANPDYPDVLTALIRRTQAAGRSADAQAHLKAWLQRDPANPAADHLRQELAA